MTLMMGFFQPEPTITGEVVHVDEPDRLSGLVPSGGEMTRAALAHVATSCADGTFRRRPSN
jgi:hypothetical protein